MDLREFDPKHTVDTCVKMVTFISADKLELTVVFVVILIFVLLPGVVVAKAGLLYASLLLKQLKFETI